MNIINENTPEILTWAIFIALTAISFFIVFVIIILSIMISCKVVKEIKKFLN